jgi:tetratricopeptide (TPR) repeat protein
MNITSCYKQT